MTNLAINLPVLVTLSGVLTLFYFSYWMRIATVVIPAPTPMNHGFMKETK